ncbi:alkaline shock response membrane anchor protein AmaP [Saccharomonospora sp. NPDC046836]|uniref:alkaline shock response membrane anchor protein AmaP n=1 Tax=Saccharomonospora sp. NPDC046836 TaxID=3156921 RepID=UPI0033FBE985
MSKPVSVAAQSRSQRTERVLTFAAGLVLLAAGALALVVASGALGEFRAQRPVLDPVALDWLGRQQQALVRGVAIAAGVALFAFGLWWFVRSLRPEGRPDIELDREPGRGVTVTSTAITDAVEADAEAIEGISRARARSVGDTEHPALRLHLWLREGSDLRHVWHELDTQVLARARESLGVPVLPTAVRLELGSGRRQRVR